MKIDGEHYFESPTEDNIEAWPTVLREAKAKELCLSALGALIWYLQTVSDVCTALQNNHANSPSSRLNAI